MENDETGVTMTTVSNLSILFADVSGSSRLYERLGDAEARDVVSNCLDLLAHCVARHDGTVVKTIGDEIMCTFATADQGVVASMDMQVAVTEELPALCPRTTMPVAVRVGLHYGPAIIEGDDVFGDAVNVASRMAGLAKGGQIITTRTTADRLSTVLKASVRHIDRIPVKGKLERVDIFEVIWEPAEDVTNMWTGLIHRGYEQSVLKLRCNDEELTLSEEAKSVVLGRSRKADMIIDDDMASRQHARIECRRGKFVLTDMSTNGTYVLTSEGAAYLRRENMTLSGQGQIALGREIEEAGQVLTFDCGQEAEHPRQDQPTANCPQE